MMKIEVAPDRPPNFFVLLTVGALVLSLLIKQLAGISGWALAIVVIALNSLVLSADSYVLKRNGFKAPTVWIILVPIYLWQRANLLRDKTRPYFWTWVAVFVLFVSVPVPLRTPPRLSSQVEAGSTGYRTTSTSPQVPQQDWARPTISQAQTFYDLGRKTAETLSSTPNWNKLALTEVGKLILKIEKYAPWFVTEEGWLYDVESVDPSAESFSWLAFLTPCAHMFALGMEEHFANRPPLTSGQIGERLNEVTNKVDIAFFRVAEITGVEAWDITWNVTVSQRGIALGDGTLAPVDGGMFLLDNVPMWAKWEFSKIAVPLDHIPIQRGQPLTVEVYT